MTRPITLITGASAGIGMELARIFAQHGHELVLVARREQQMRTLADDLAGQGHPRPTVLAVDLGRPEAVRRVARELLERALEPQFVVNNAGFGLSGPAAVLSRAEQLAMIDLNVRALTELSLTWIDQFVRHKGGILNVASVAGFIPGPGMAVYYASKAYVVSFSEALHQELAPQGVRVTALCPGPVATEFQARAGMTDGASPRLLALPAAYVAGEGYNGLMQGRRLVVPGPANKAITVLTRLMPRGLLLSMIAARQRNRRKT